MWNRIKQKAKELYNKAKQVIAPVVKKAAPVVKKVINVVKATPQYKRADTVYRTVRNVVNKTKTNYSSPKPKPRPTGPTQAQINLQKARSLVSGFTKKVTTPKTWFDMAQNKAVTGTAAWIRKTAPKVWKKAATGWGNSKVGNWADDTFMRPGREMNQKAEDADRLERQAQMSSKIWERRTTKIQNEVNAKIRLRDSGKWTSEQYKTWVKKMDQKWTAEAKKDIQWFADREKDIASPIRLNKTSQAIAKGLDWADKNPIAKFFGNVAKYTIGGGDQKIPSIATAPKRAFLALRNWSEHRENSKWGYQHKDTFYDGDRPQNPQNAWQESWNQRVYPDAKFMGTENDTGKRRANWWAEFVSDPAWFIPAGSGSKILGKGFNLASKTSTMRSVKAIWDTDGQPVAKFIKWLGQDAPTYGDKLQRSLEKAAKGKRFDDLPGDEQKLVRELIGGGVDLRGKNVDAILDIVKAKNKMYKTFLSVERKSGIKRSERAGYFGKTTSDRLTKERILGKTDASKWRSKGDTIHTTRASFADAEATRRYIHLRDTGQLAPDHDKMALLKQFNDEALNSVKGISDTDLQQVQKIMLNQKLTKTLGRSFGSGATKTSLRKFITPAIERAGKDVRKVKIINQLKSGRVIPWKGGAISPNQLWKKSVLQFRPSWYVNNASWNVPASMMAGGKGTVRSYGKIAKNMVKERSLSPKMIESMPDEVVGSGLYNEFGKQGKRAFGEKVENFSRAAAYDALLRKGVSPVDAVKRVNKYLFDYKTTKNWERPFKAVFPFWNWSKNITRLTAQMPLDNAKATKIFREVRAQFMDRPLSEIPDKQMSFTDPETGQEITYNPRDGYRGKIKIPGKGWRTIPFLPIMPEQLDEIGLNPWIRLSAEYFSGEDSFGRSFFGEDSVLDRLQKAFPQLAIAKSFREMMEQKTGSKTGEKFWISESGYTKSKQGFDSSKGNYDENMDKTKKYERDIKNFATGGWGNYKKDFDPKQFKDTESYRAFSKEYFSHDWDKEFPDSENFAEKEAAKKKIAKKYGYDLDKDIYKGKWRKYDTPDTLKKKAGKESMIAKRKEIYADYQKIEKGTGDRTRFIKKWKDAIVNDPEILKKFPGLDIFPNTDYSTLKLKNKTAVQWKGKWFKSPASRDRYIKYITNKPFWDKYWAASKDQRRALIATRPDLQTKKLEPLSRTAKNPKVRMAWAYENLDPVKRSAFFKEQGFRPAENVSWEVRRKRSSAKKSDDLRANSELRKWQSRYDKGITRTVRGKKVKQGRRISWGSNKKLDTRAWRVR